MLIICVNAWNLLANKCYDGQVKLYRPKLEQALFKNGTPICTEQRRITRTARQEMTLTNRDFKQEVDLGETDVSKFSMTLQNKVNERIHISGVCTLIEKAFYLWDRDAVANLLKVANASGSFLQKLVTNMIC